MNYGLAYLSRANAKITLQLAQEICDVANRNNKTRGITGFLTYDQKHFFQYIEGSKDSVKQLISTIVRDPRHTHLAVVYEGETSERLLMNWHMHFVDPTQMEPNLLASIFQHRTREFSSGELLSVIRALRFS